MKFDTSNLLIRFVVPAKDKAHAGKGIVLAQFNNLSGLVDAGEWNELMETMGGVFSAAVDGPVMGMGYGYVPEGDDAGSDLGVQYCEIPAEALAGFDKHVASRAKGQDKPLKDTMPDAVADSIDRLGATLFAPIAKDMLADPKLKARFAELPDHVREVVELVAKGDTSESTFNKLIKASDTMREMNAKRDAKRGFNLGDLIDKIVPDADTYAKRHAGDDKVAPMTLADESLGLNLIAVHLKHGETEKAHDTIHALMVKGPDAYDLDSATKLAKLHDFVRKDQINKAISYVDSLIAALPTPVKA